VDGGTQQPTEIRPKQWDIVGGDSTQGDDNGGGCRHIFLAIELKGKKMNKTKFVVALGGRQLTISFNNQPNTRNLD
jgi:hypothetical protein